jgi:hypothetical protein
MQQKVNKSSELAADDAFLNPLDLSRPFTHPQSPVSDLLDSSDHVQSPAVAPNGSDTTMSNRPFNPAAVLKGSGDVVELENKMDTSSEMAQDQYSGSTDHTYVKAPRKQNNS